jgi:hypothetical protein
MLCLKTGWYDFKRCLAERLEVLNMTLKKLTEIFKDSNEVVFVGVQTVFEGYSTNTKEKLRENQLKCELKIPMAHAPGNPETHEIPLIMRNYRSGGTPWAVIIDPTGKAVYNNFHIDVKPAVQLIENLLAQKN